MISVLKSSKLVFASLLSTPACSNGLGELNTPIHIKCWNSNIGTGVYGLAWKNGFEDRAAVVCNNIVAAVGHVLRRCGRSATLILLIILPKSKLRSPSGRQYTLLMRF